MTPEQEKTYGWLSVAGYEFDRTEPDGAVIVKRWERGFEYSTCLETQRIPADGKPHQVQD